MKKQFVYDCTLRLVIVGFIFFLSLNRAEASGKTYYQLTVYHYATEAQEQVLDTYLQQALLPALHRQQLKQVGVFKAISNDTSTLKKLYVLIPFHSLEAVTAITLKLQNDKEYQTKGAAYIN